MVAVVQLVRASDCGSECRGFESHLPPIRSSSSELLFLFPPISQAHSQAHPAHSQAHPAHSRAHPTHYQHHPAHSQAHPAHSQAHPAHSRAHPTHYQHHPAHSRAHPTHSRAHPVYIQAPTPPHRHRPRKMRKHPTPPGAHPGKAGGRPDKTGEYLHAAADHLGRRASDDTSFRIVRNSHPYRPIRTSAPSDTRQQ